MSFKIAYCAGHGYNTAGKRTPNGEREWDFNNKVAVAFAKEMSKYEGVILKRMDDPTGKTDVPLKARTDGANKWGADIYISFHHNANTGKWGNWTGVETFVQTGVTGKALELAKLVNPEIVKAYGLANRGVKHNNLHITRETKMPAILIEGGFMDSTIDIVKLRNNTVLANAGIGTAKAVAQFAKLKLKVVKPVAKPSQPVTKPTTNLYRVRKTWSDVNSQIGAYSVLQNAIDLAKSKSGYKVFDKDGKQVYPTVTVAPAPKKQTYRVRKSWSDVKSQIGAYTVLQNAKDLADKNAGYKVFDESGKVVYTPPVKKVTHTVVKGDTLWGIANKYKVTVDEIKSKNKLKNDVINVGQKLVIK